LGTILVAECRRVHSYPPDSQLPQPLRPHSSPLSQTNSAILGRLNDHRACNHGICRVLHTRHTHRSRCNLASVGAPSTARANAGRELEAFIYFFISHNLISSVYTKSSKNHCTEGVAVVFVLGGQQIAMVWFNCDNCGDSIKKVG
jgi:hypothetical protein